MLHEHQPGGLPVDLLLLIPAAAAAAAYWAGVLSPRSGVWPVYRSVAFTAGTAAVLVTAAGPLPAQAHGNFALMAVSHVLAGMLGPLLLVIARPVTLALRTMDPVPARRLVRVLRSIPARFLAHPVTAAVLSMGGMVLMFRTPLFDAMRTELPVHWLVTFHLAAAGYLWTAALIGRDPNPHRASLRLRAAVLVLTMAAHNVLAKSLYATPPAGIRTDQGEAGAMVLYYAGGAVELAVIFLLCLQWYRKPPGRRTMQRARSANRRNGPFNGKTAAAMESAPE
ncbi:cytochrome c oxidase assembly protein [Arthrobacter sp. Sa2CUA1]|uniref:Cytochrome c oxidase assembly protein n=1 Tax=Arthrobacter gallicola TaxID=2762225 RepID=A0ABR8URJ8_9MICC|nr:cytochrome c oxidase assembly protein [Arthrobacter gallicola]MBD7995187.1 cytochrome c oxidase assembly protein [Arthrobacter gallicola]